MIFEALLALFAVYVLLPIAVLMGIVKIIKLLD